MAILTIMATNAVTISDQFYLEERPCGIDAPNTMVEHYKTNHH